MSNHIRIGLLLGIGACLYLALPVRILECDAVMFSYGALHRDIVFLGYPHHLGYNLLQYLAAAVGQRLVPPLGPIHILQYLSIAAGLGGVLLFYRFLTRRRGPSRALVLAGTLLFSYAYWHYSRQADTHIIGAFFLICFLLRYERFLKSPSVADGAVSGLLLGMATIMHQSNILLLPAVGASAFLKSKQEHGGLAPLGALVAVYSAVGVLPYPIVARALVGTKTPDEFLRWILCTSEWGGWGKWQWQILPATFIGLQRSFIGSHYLLGFKPIAALAYRLFPFGSLEDEMAIARAVPTHLRWFLLAVHGGLLVGLVRVLVRISGKLEQVFSADRPYAVFLLVWISVYGIFFAWWAPERVDFWIAWFVPVIALLAEAGPGEAGAPVGRPWSSIAFLIGLVFLNLSGSIYPQSGPIEERDTSVAVAIDAVVVKGDIVVSDCSFEGRASRFVISFDRVNLLAPPVDGFSFAGPSTVYLYKACQPDEPSVPATETTLKYLRDRALATMDSLLAAAETDERAVYLLVSPVSINPTRTSIYSALVEAIGERFDISRAVPVRERIDLREVRQR